MIQSAAGCRTKRILQVAQNRAYTHDSRMYPGDRWKGIHQRRQANPITSMFTGASQAEFICCFIGSVHKLTAAAPRPQARSRQISR